MKRSPHLTLELLRGGTPHNQLVSPAIEYLALCGDAAPYTLHIPFEHRDLTDRLLALRYGYQGGQKNAQRFRKAELERLARQIGDILGSIPAFAAEISGIDPPGNGDIVHLRLVLAGNELSLIPWEISQVPSGLPGAGLFLLLQPRIPISTTREVRGASRRQFTWDRKPKVLFVTTNAGDFPPNTIEAHLLGLRLALKSWIYDDWEGNGWQKDQYPIEVLEYATVDKIREKCLEQDFTHVHILAHGCPIGDEGELRYGLLLHKSSNPGDRESVTGEQLAQALLPSRCHRNASDPVMVTLATCDSANQADVVNVGGSVAHTLHHMGVPWVIASQFPLTVTGSVILAADFYKTLFEGADPRMALHQVRQHLNTRFGDRHDWATVAAYASFPPDFDNQAEDFRQRAMRQQRNHAFALVDEAVFGYLIADEKTPKPLFEQLTKLKERFPKPTAEQLTKARHLVEECINRMEQMETIVTDELTPRTKQLEAKTRLKNAEFWNTRAGLHKRVAELHYLEMKIQNKENAETWIEDLRKAFEDYKKGLNQDIPVDHWLLVQYFVLKTVMCKLSGKETSLSQREKVLWQQADASIMLELTSDKPINKIWAHSSLADFLMVSQFIPLELQTKEVSSKKNPLKPKDVKDQLEQMLKTGECIDTSCALFSTFRQFWRWHQWWLPEIENKSSDKHPSVDSGKDAYKFLFEEIINKLSPNYSVSKTEVSETKK